jgi:hypothetical protein
VRLPCRFANEQAFPGEPVSNSLAFMLVTGLGEVDRLIWSLFPAQERFCTGVET